MDEMKDLDFRIKRDTRLVFKMSNLVGTFPYDVHSLKLSKLFTLCTIVIFGIIFRLMNIAYVRFIPRSGSKGEFYTLLLLKCLTLSIVLVCVILLCHMFTVRNRLKTIFLELNRVHSYFIQLSCDGVTPNVIAKKHVYTISLFIFLNMATLTHRLINLHYGLHLTSALFMFNFVTFSTVLQCTNLLDLVKHYLNIINIELINISNNQDKQHYIHLYKSRICVLNNMLPENYLSRRKLKVMVHLHFTLCKLGQDIVNRAYSLPLFALMLVQSVHLTSSIFLSIFLLLRIGSFTEIIHQAIYYGAWITYDFFILVWIIRHCENTKNAALSLLELAYHKIIYNEVPALNTELIHFLDLLCGHRIQFRALDVFEIDFTVLRHMIGAVITYGVILVQLSFST